MRYNSPVTPGDKLRDFFLRGGIPVTLTILGVNILTFLAGFFSRDIARPFIGSELVFSTDNAFHAPWTFLTYPLVSLGFSIWLLISWAFLWISGGSLERSWGSTRFAVFFFAVTVFSAASLLLGGMLRHEQVLMLTDLFLPLTGLIVAFCMLNPVETIMLYFVPVQARWVALIVTAFVFFQYGSLYDDPVMGLFACGGILAAFLYVRFARPWADIGSYGAPRRLPRGPDLRVYPAARSSSQTTLDGSRKRGLFDLAGRWKDWQERRKLEKLLRNSGFSDLEPRWRDDEERRRR